MIGVLHDVTRCVGCMRCVEACTDDNYCGNSGATAVRFRPGDLSADRMTTVRRTPEGRNMRWHCLHCLEPACEAACLVGALERTADGRVVYDASKCIGCRYCMLACPFEIPKYEWKSAHPYVRKCDLCFDRPEGPACVANCPHEAMEFGERDDLIAIAKERIRTEPDRYLPHIWGEKEAGGTAVLFLSDVSLDRYWPTKLGETSVPDLTWPVVSKTPFLALGVAGFLSAASWVIHRRNRLAAEAAQQGGSESDV